MPAPPIITTLPINSTLNPIIPGFSPDPTIQYWPRTQLYYLVTSTFHFFPGLPIYTSPDLIHWTLHSHAISRPSQLSLFRSRANLIDDGSIDNDNDNADEDEDVPGATTGTKLCFQGGLYAPTLRYEKTEGRWYLLCTNVVTRKEADDEDEDDDDDDGGGSGEHGPVRNFWVTNVDLEDEAGWSDPVYFDFKGIDPSIHFEYDETARGGGEVGDGSGPKKTTRAWICGSRFPGPATKINLFEVDLKTGRKLGEETTLWEGEIKFYPEGPHIYKQGGWYWLVIAEGGTHEGHCVNVARSRTLQGPYEADPNNPVVKQCEDGDAVQCTGHFDLVEGKGGQWYGVCLGIRRRRGEKGVRMTHGRETFLTKAYWPENADTDNEHAWLRIDKVQLEVEGLKRKGAYKPAVKRAGLDMVWIRDPVLSDYDIEGGGRRITIKTSKGDLDQWELPVSFVGKRQRLMEARSEVRLDTKGVNGISGLAVYKDEHRFVRLSFNGQNNRLQWQLQNNAKDLARSYQVNKSLSGDDHLWLQIAYSEEKYVFSFRDSQDVDWEMVAEIDTAEMSAPDFVGPIIGVFAVGSNAERAQFEDFEVDIE